MALDAGDLAVMFGMTPEDAVRYVEGKGYQITWNWWEARDEAHAKAFTVAKVSRVDILQDIQDALVKNLREGETERDFVKRLTPVLQAKGWWGRQIVTDAAGNAQAVQLGSPRRLATIYRTNAQAAYMAGRYKAMSAAIDSHPYWQYVAILDDRTRASHRALAGKVFAAEDAIWRHIWPPNGYNCFPAGTPVRADARVGLKTFYAGKMVELHTRLGHRLTVTANHPVLTGRGWLSAHMIQKGDQALGDTCVVDAPVIGVVNHEQPPALAEDVFEALAAQGFRVIPMAPHDFHADAHLRKPEIEVAGADRGLMDEIGAPAQQLVGQRQLGAANAGGPMHADLAGRPAQRPGVVADAVLAQQAADVAQARADLPRDGALGGQSGPIKREDAPFGVRIALIGGPPGGAALLGDGSGVGLDGAPLDELRFGSVAQTDAAQTEQPAKGGAAAAGLFGELIEANPGLIAVDEIVEIRQFDWAGHVYDFETDTGLMIAGGLVVHNCRCRVRPLSRADLEREGLAPMSSTKRIVRIDDATPADPRTGEVEKVTRIGIRVPGPDGKDVIFAPDIGFGGNPGRDWARPFTPPPRDTLPRTFLPGQALPDLPAPSRVPASRLLPDGLPPEDYARAFLSEFGADIGKPVAHVDPAGDALAISEALFQDGAGNWKADKRGRGPSMLLLADTIREPDEIWLRWELSREAPDKWLLKRRYLKAFEVEGEGGEIRFGVASFEYGRDGWHGSTVFSADAKTLQARRGYMERQRDGFLLYRKN